MDKFHLHHIQSFHNDKTDPYQCSNPDDRFWEHPEFECPEEGEDLFSMDLPTVSFISHTAKRHSELLQLERDEGEEDEDNETIRLLKIIALLVDPVTQPMESDHHVISLELVSQLVIYFGFDQKSIIPEFELSFKLFNIIERCLDLLNCSDELNLRKLNNADLKVDWKLHLSEWTPQHHYDEQDMRLIYMILSVCIFTIYKLYSFKEPDLCLNPYLGFFLKLWKIFTNVVLLGLEIDRRLEANEIEETPLIVKEVIRGSATARHILASILNDDVSNRYHDFNHVNIVDFCSPYGRKVGSGSLYADVRWYVGAMLALGSELNEVVEALVDLEPNDRYDEDVKYMFDYEFEDFQQDEELMPYKREPIIYEDEDGLYHKIVKKRCTCEFFDMEEDDEEEDLVNDDDDDDDDVFEDEKVGHGAHSGQFNSIPTAIKTDDIEFDEMGRDWRDIPRSGNIFFNSKLSLSDESKSIPWNDLFPYFILMCEEPISEEIGEKILFTIARAVKLEFENEISKSVNQNKESDTEKDVNLVTPEKIYSFWSIDIDFEAMLSLNPEITYCMLDEMFMAHGYRRVLIWFLTHLALSFNLMNYIFELIMGLRGETKISKKYEFSRQGALVLSEVETSMLLHEFLNNCLIYLSRQYEKYHSVEETEAQNYSELERCIKFLKLICLIVNKIIENQIIDIDEYKVELTSLLINWIGLIPEAKDLFFKINQNSNEDDLSEFIEQEKTLVSKKTQEPSSSIRTVIPRHKRFNKDLKISLGNVIKKLDSGSLLFKPFFELIDEKSYTKDSERLNEEEEASHNVFPSPDYNQNYNYVKGELVPFQEDEDFEHEQVEAAIAQ